jgi:hypothetical protein
MHLLNNPVLQPKVPLASGRPGLPTRKTLAMARQSRGKSLSRRFRMPMMRRRMGWNHEGTVMIRYVVAILGALIFASVAYAQLPFPLPLPLPLPGMDGTPEDRAACEGDVRRYCQGALPDNMRVLACLQQNRQRISPSCQGVLLKYGQ